MHLLYEIIPLDISEIQYTRRLTLVLPGDCRGGYPLTADSLSPKIQQRK